jgi:HSP20 family molecular chaperone IbpA
MLNRTRWSPFDEVLNFQREVDRVFNQFWNDLPATTASATGAFQVNTSEDGWHIDVPLPGIDPQHVQLQVTGRPTIGTAGCGP